MSTAINPSSEKCLDCDGEGRYPSGARCKSCGGTGRVLPGDGEALPSNERSNDPAFLTNCLRRCCAPPGWTLAELCGWAADHMTSNQTGMITGKTERGVAEREAHDAASISKLVSRLREFQADTTGHMLHRAAFQEAADEIERLRQPAADWERFAESVRDAKRRADENTP
jgi:hypothetical protein